MDRPNQEAVSDVSHEDVVTGESPSVIEDSTEAGGSNTPASIGDAASFSAGGSERADTEPAAAAAVTDESGAGITQRSVANAPFGLAMGMEGMGISGIDGGSSSGQNNGNINNNNSSILATDIDLDFNVDSLNLDSLDGLDFDVSNLLSQVSGSTMAAVVGSSGGIKAQEPGTQGRAPVLSAMPADGAQTGLASAALAPSARPPSAGATAQTQPATHKQPHSAMPGSAPVAAPAAVPARPGQGPGPGGAGARPARPPQAMGGVGVRPRPARPVAAAPSGGAQSPQVRPPGPGGGQVPQRPPAAFGGARPPGVRPGQAGMARPRPASPARPGMRPAVRPRPLARPPQAAAPGTSLSPTANARPPMRPATRPVMRPAASSAPASATAAQSGQGGGPSAATARSPPVPGHGSAPVSAPAGGTFGRTETAGAGAGAGSGLANGGGSVVVSSPPPLAEACGLEALYSLEGVFRALCHGFAPTSAEWSTLNVVAVTWPQLEAGGALGGRRLAQRSIADVSSMTAADSARAAASRRAASAAIHLYRLHVQAPQSWDGGAGLRPLAPSLLPLCSVRLQQQWSGAAEDAGPAALGDGAWLDVAPLSGWHGGASQAGAGERMRVAAAPRCMWSADSRMLAAWDRSGRFEVFQAGAELNAWRSVYHIDFDCAVAACLWLASKRKYGVGRTGGGGDADCDEDADAGCDEDAAARWQVDPGVGIKRLPFFGPRNTQGEHALLVLTAASQLVLVYQRDAAWTRVVAPLEPQRLDVRSEVAGDGGGAAAARDDPWRNVPKGAITHADMMLVSQKWIFLAAHRAAAAPVAYPHAPGALGAAAAGGAMTAPMAEVYRVQVEFAADYSPRLFATPLAVQPVAAAAAAAADAARDGPARVTHIKLVTALNPEARPVAENVLGERYHFPLVLVALGRTCGGAFATELQAWRLEGAAHARRSVADLLRRPPALQLAHVWTERRSGVLVAVSANRAERQQLRYLFARASDTAYRAVMLTWADGRVEMLRSYGAAGRRFAPPHYTAFFQLAMRPQAVALGGPAAEAGVPACEWRQARARFRLGWTPFFGGPAGGGPVQAHCGDLLAVRILNREDATDLVALLANAAAAEENEAPAEERTAPAEERTAPAEERTAPAVPMSRTLFQALYRACTLLAAALGVDSLELDALAAATPAVRALLGAAMQLHHLARHAIQATSVGLLLHAAAVVEARVAIVQQHVLASVGGQAPFDVARSFSDAWRRGFPATVALVLWCVDVLAALVRDTFLYFHARGPDAAGHMRPLHELDAAAAAAAAEREQALLRAFRGEPGAADARAVLPGALPTRLALLFHRPTLDALRSLLAFVAHVEADLVRRMHVLGSLAAAGAAAAAPEYAAALRARDMVVAAAQQLAHALEHLPVSLQRLRDFLADVHALYAADAECTALSAQAVLVATATVAGPFRKHVPHVARSFAHFVLARDVVDTPATRAAAPAALVLHDTRWLSVVSCRATPPGLRDAAAVFATPWRTCLPAAAAAADATADADADADDDALVPAAERAAWAREQSEFERALDEDNVLFDIDDAGFIFVDPGDAADPPAAASAAPLPAAFRAAAARGAAAAPVRITTRVPDFSDVLAPLAARRGVLAAADAAADCMLDAPLLLDAACARRIHAADVAAAAPGRRARTPSSSTAPHSPAMAPRAAWLSPPPPPAATAPQHFVPHYSSVASPWSAGELSSGWQFISTPRDPKLHVPTLLAQHAFSLAVLRRRRAAAAMHTAADADDDAEDGGDNNADGMAYCIDWSRADAIVVQPPPPPAAAAAAAAPDDAAALGPRLLHAAADAVDVIQKTMLPADAPCRTCLRCGQSTRQNPPPGDGNADAGWISRFDLVCICGGPWVAS
ncbi:hypothetical protein GGI15_003730 [Coemansia interrupta]|uniref:Mediator of RNA polymerase II transcription subunit 16 n=1 Tax=Coemansia interrupta TaxID=1126814 RepID=A0A9W8HB31_9FUNG|nr:hypothetical protein GGI15_003730 [Coemansia interrupta]